MPTDVLIFEDWQAQDRSGEANEVQQIAEWLGLNEPWFCRHGWRWQRAAAFPRTPPPGVPDPEVVDQGWAKVKREILAADPLLVVFDWLLSGEQDDQPYSGLEFAKWCKAEQYWPKTGVIVVTTGYRHIGSQSQLDELRRRGGWPIDYAWVKRWSRGVPDAHQTVSHWVKALMEDTDTWRPSQHVP